MRCGITLALTLLSAQLFAAEPPLFQADFFQNKYWRDGKAEVSVYNATEKREGLVRTAEVHHIVVRETFSPKTMVKSDDWQAPGAYDVLKLNQIITVPAGTFNYYQMHSSFWKVDSGQLIKFSVVSIDSCGNSYKEGRINGSVLSYLANTYWEGMDRVTKEEQLPQDSLFYDELPLKLRSLDWKNVSSFSASVIPTMIGGKADPLVATKADFTVEQTAAKDGWQVRIKSEKGEELFTFAKDYPYLLREWKSADGARLQLKSSVRIPYWQLNKPGDEKYLNDVDIFTP